MTGIKGLTLLPEEAESIRAEKIGGVILFSHNFEKREKVKESTKKLAIEAG